MDQLIANIANAQHSTGPKTEKGKHLPMSSRPSTNTAPAFANPSNPSARWSSNSPNPSPKTTGASSARAIETGIFAAGVLGQLGHPYGGIREDPAQIPIDEALSKAHTWIAKSENFQLLALYEQRIHRAIEKNIAQLRTLRAERKAARQQALEEAQLLAQLAHSKGEEYDPASDFPPELLQIGSDFLSAGLSRLIKRSQRLSEARHLLVGRPILAAAGF
jgi:hypothetical protein